MPNLYVIPSSVANPSETTGEPDPRDLPGLSPTEGRFKKLIRQVLQTSRRPGRESTETDATDSFFPTLKQLSVHRKSKNSSPSLQALHELSSTGSPPRPDETYNNLQCVRQAPGMPIDAREVTSATSEVLLFNVPEQLAGQLKNCHPDGESQNMSKRASTIDQRVRSQGAAPVTRNSMQTTSSKMDVLGGPDHAPKNRRCEPFAGKAGQNMQASCLRTGQNATTASKKSVSAAHDLVAMTSQSSPAKPEVTSYANSSSQRCSSCGMPGFQCRSADDHAGANAKDFQTLQIKVESRDHERLLKYLDDKTQRVPPKSSEETYATLYLVRRSGATDKQVEVRVGKLVGPRKGNEPMVYICQRKRLEIVSKFRDLVRVLKQGGVASAYIVDSRGTIFGVLLSRSW